MSSALGTAVVVDDDPLILGLLTEVFESAGFAVTATDSGAEAVQAILGLRPMIASIDLAMPGLDGIEAVRRVRAAGVETHIIMISASDAETDVVLGLAAGADEYLFKPIRVRELRARIAAVVRRASRAAAATEPVHLTLVEPLQDVEDAGTPDIEPQPVEAPPELLTHHDLALDPSTRTVRRGGTVIDLTPVEFALLEALVRSGTAMRSKADLSLVLRGLPASANAFAGADEKAEVDRHMSSLFGKLEADIWQPRYIKAVQPVGYRLTAD